MPYGGAYVFDRLWRRLELDKVLGDLLTECSFGHDVERALFALVANQALDPRSKLAIERWVGRRVAIDGLAEVERGFRTLKSTLELRPSYHRLPERIEAHVLLRWLALLLVRSVELETGQGWERVRDTLAEIHSVDLRAKDGVFQMVTKLTGEQRNLLKALDIPAPRQVRAARVETPAA